MTESEPKTSDSDGFSIEDLDGDDLAELADKVARELESRDKERVSASLGMMTLEVESHESLDDTVEAFETLWSNRVTEVEDSVANTLKQSLEDDSGGIMLG